MPDVRTLTAPGGFVEMPPAGTNWKRNTVGRCRVLAETREDLRRARCRTTFQRFTGDGVSDRMSLPYSWRATFQRLPSLALDKRPES
jgi:hypothetical protein